MSETPLEVLKRQLREGEERLKHPSAAQVQPASPGGLEAGAGLARPQSQAINRSAAPKTREQMRILALESQILASNAFLNAVMRSGAVPILLLRGDGAILDANDAACRWFGSESKRLVNTRLQDHLGVSSRKEFDTALSRSLSLAATTDISCRFRRLSGAEFDARVSLSGLADSSEAFRILVTMDRMEVQHPEEKASPDWVAFGQMTPAILKELSQFISESTQELAQRIGKSDVSANETSLERLIQSMVRVGASLSAWADSAKFLSESPTNGSVAKLVEEVVAARRPELQRWRIRTTVQIPDHRVKEITCTRSLYLVLLHILQSVVEEIQESVGAARLVIRVQQPGERIEITFDYEVSGFAAGAQHDVAGFTEHLRHIELRAAQKLLDSMGGSLVLENITPTHRAIRLNISLAALSGTAMNLKTQGGS
jgi:PAS domain S-box-containing protein